MIIELGNIHAKWKVLIGNMCMLLANENETMWIGTGFGVHGRVTNKWKTNYMEGVSVAKLIGMETETAKAILTRTGIDPCIKPSLLTDLL